MSRRPSYKPPAADSTRARARFKQWLVEARDDRVRDADPAYYASLWNVELEHARREIAVERVRRGLA